MGGEAEDGSRLCLSGLRKLAVPLCRLGARSLFGQALDQRPSLSFSTHIAKNALVMIVEDEAIISFELVSRFEELGLTPLAASNADEAIALLEKHPEIELVLTDVKMPSGSIDGLRLAHHVRSRWPLVKIIILSGVFEIDDMQLPDSSIFLTKPCAPETLMDAMAHMIHRHV